MICTTKMEIQATTNDKKLKKVFKKKVTKTTPATTDLRFISIMKPRSSALKSPRRQAAWLQAIERDL